MISGSLGQRFSPKNIFVGFIVIVTVVALLFSQYVLRERVTTEEQAQVPTRTPTPTLGGPLGPTSTPTPTPGTWYKVRNSNFHRAGVLTNAIPYPVGDDVTTGVDYFDEPENPCNNNPNSALVDALYCFNTNRGGLVTAEGAIDLGQAPVSKREWKLENYTMKKTFSPDVYLAYVKAKRRYVTMTPNDGFITDDELQKNKINVIQGDYAIEMNGLSTFPTSSPFVLIVDGNLTLTPGVVAQGNQSFAVVVTGQLNITSALVDLTGVFIADTIDFASDVAATPGSFTSNRLVIHGNVIVNNPTDTYTKRNPFNGLPESVLPSVFVIADAQQMITFLPFLSIKNYSWEEVVP